MARSRQRIRLEDGLKLDLNEFIRRGLGPRRNRPQIFTTTWTSSHRGEIATAWITIREESEDHGLLRIMVGEIEQRISLTAQPRHFGGRQWYLQCPVTQKKCSVLWLPPCESRFCSRQAWGKQVAYSTQFESKFDRAITAREKIKDRLIGNLDRREWELPPKPKGMRWHTYERLAEKYLFNQRVIDRCIAAFVG